MVFVAGGQRICDFHFGTFQDDFMPTFFYFGGLLVNSDLRLCVLVSESGGL